MSTIQTSGDFATGPQSGWAALAERRWFVVAVYLTLTAIALYPIFSVTVPPLVDYPNHLARMHILASWDSDPALQKNYIADWKLHPNMAMELIVPFLARFMPIYMAGKVFIAATLLVLLGGTLTLRKVVVGRIGLWPVVTFLFLYNHVLFWGFLDYLFTAGLALFAFSGWIVMQGRGPWLRGAVFSCVAAALFVGHIFGLFVYGLLVSGYELAKLWDRRKIDRVLLRDWAVTGVQFVLPAFLFIQWMIGNSTGDRTINEFGPLATRFVGLISPVHIGLPRIDIPTAVFLAILLVLCRSNKSVGFAPELKVPVLVMAGVAILMPHYLSGVWGTHIRIPTMIACVLVAGVRFGPEAKRISTRIACAAVAMLCLRTAVISHNWADFDRKFDEFRDASAAIVPGSRIFVVEDDEDLPPGKIATYGMQFWHLPALAVIERSAFLPNMFTGHIGLRASEAVEHINSPVGMPLSRAFLRDSIDPAESRFPLGFHYSRYIWVYWTGWPAHFDYLVSVRFANVENPAPEQLEAVERGSFFDIYRITKPKP